MSEEQAEYIISKEEVADATEMLGKGYDRPGRTKRGFEKQTYTQTPNSLFEIMRDMDECELKVVLYVCRMTFGYHREEAKISTRRLAEVIGMNTASVQKGARAAEKRGLIERIMDGQNTTTWRAIVETGDSESDTPSTKVIQNLIQGDSKIESQVGLNKDKERDSKKGNGHKKGDLIDGVMFYAEQSKERGEDKVEEILNDLERLLKRNIQRTGAWQDLARWMLKRRDTESHTTWAEHYMADPFNAKTSWRLTPAQVRASWPQAFAETDAPTRLEDRRFEPDTTVYAPLTGLRPPVIPEEE